jgi:hypothetical protein
MSSTTNTAINSRSMNGIITITDGIATLENGDLDCDDIKKDIRDMKIKKMITND